jgi:hypothetical protein
MLLLFSLHVSIARKLIKVTNTHKPNTMKISVQSYVTLGIPAGFVANKIYEKC